MAQNLLKTLPTVITFVYSNLWSMLSTYPKDEYGRIKMKSESSVKMFKMKRKKTTQNNDEKYKFIGATGRGGQNMFSPPPPPFKKC